MMYFLLLEKKEDVSSTGKIQAVQVQFQKGFSIRDTE